MELLVSANQTFVAPLNKTLIFSFPHLFDWLSCSPNQGRAPEQDNPSLANAPGKVAPVIDLLAPQVHS